MAFMMDGEIRRRMTEKRWSSRPEVRRAEPYGEVGYMAGWLLKLRSEKTPLFMHGDVADTPDEAIENAYRRAEDFLDPPPWNDIKINV